MKLPARLSKLVGPAITFACIAVLELLALTSWRIPAPGTILLLAVVLSVFLGGLPARVISGALILLYALHHHDEPGRIWLTESSQQRIIELAVVTMLMVFLVETERRRLVRHEREQAARNESEATYRRLERLVQSLDAIVWDADARTYQFTFISRQAERILGYPVHR